MAKTSKTERHDPGAEKAVAKMLRATGIPRATKVVIGPYKGKGKK